MKAGNSRGDAEARRAESTEDLNQITGTVINTALEIHKKLGPGLFESVYEAILEKKLERLGFRVARQTVVPIQYEDMLFDEGFRADLIVNEAVCLELKSVETLAPVHSKQLLTYLKLLNLEVGLLINFEESTLKDGLHRIVNNFTGPALSASPRLRVRSRS